MKKRKRHREWKRTRKRDTERDHVRAAPGMEVKEEEKAYPFFPRAHFPPHIMITLMQKAFFTFPFPLSPLPPPLPFPPSRPGLGSSRIVALLQWQCCTRWHSSAFDFFCVVWGDFALRAVRGCLFLMFSGKLRWYRTIGCYGILCKTVKLIYHRSGTFWQRLPSRVKIICIYSSASSDFFYYLRMSSVRFYKWRICKQWLFLVI